jgi:ATP-dependent exoDNAse (exonuclease V) alpha subunit
VSENQNHEHVFWGKLEGEFNYYDSLPPLELALKVDCLVVFVKNDASKRWVNGDFGIIQDFIYRIILSKGKEIITKNYQNYKTKTREIKDEITTLQNKDYELQGASYVIQVQLTRTKQIVEVEKESWDKKTYETIETSLEVDGETMIQQKLTDKIIGRYSQFPLKVGYAITVHKSQGMTLEGAVLDFGSGTFGSGLVYVALSRVKSLQNLYLTNQLRVEDIKIDPKVLEFQDIIVENGLINI